MSLTKIRGSIFDSADNHLPVNVKDFGASSSKTTAENKAALQAAISAVDSTGGGVVTVPGDIDYGYQTRDISTYPDLSGLTNDVTVYDYGIGDADGAGNKAGAQERVFFGTVQTVSPGQHDGNGLHVYGNWAPYFNVVNTSNVAPVGDPSRDAFDNRRASMFWQNDGITTWRLGQGSIAGASYTDEELSNFVIEHYQVAGEDTLANYAPLVIERKTGNWAFGGGYNAPESSYVFTPASSGYYTMQVESLSTTTTVVLRNSDGSADDLHIRNVNGVFDIFIPTVGTAVTVDRSRNMVVNGAVTTLATTVANLPSAATVGAGARHFVTDSLYALDSANLGAALGGTGGGANAIPVYSDGSIWRIG